MHETSRRRGTSDTEVERLRMQLRIQSALIAAQQAALVRSEDLFERATQAARMGLWECRLPDDTLRWTGGIYDLFGLPQATPLDRRAILGQYRPASRQSLAVSRDRAIREGSGFAIDSEIVTPDGRRRWIRATATVDRQDGVAVRLFGMMQDVTDEILLLERTRRLAECDALTGLANRAAFEARLREPLGTLLLVDLDGFKAVNDAFGHPAGDHCLREVARRLGRVCRRADLVARIGGDEFAVVLDARLDRDAAAACAQRIVEALCRPVDHEGRRYRIGASVGVALSEPDAHDLYARADAALYAAKAAGRRTFRLFEPVAVPTGPTASRREARSRATA